MFTSCHKSHDIINIGSKEAQKEGEMKRSEKLGMLTGLIVGTILLLISFMMGLKPACTVWGSQMSASEAEKKGLENSFRYKNGKPINDSFKTGRSITRITKPANAVAQGIDVSKWQGDIDWEKVKNSGQVDFVIIRCGLGMDQKNQDDPKWEYNASECERLGIPYGVYLASFADTTDKAKSEAKHVIRLIKGKKLSYPIYYDIEDDSVLRAKNMTSTKLAQIAQTFFSTLEAAGYKNLGIYSNAASFNIKLADGKLTAPIFNQYPKWVASYSDTCTYQGNYHMWQYSKSRNVDGITGEVDLNFKIGNWTKAGFIPKKVVLDKTSLTMTIGTSKTLKAYDPANSAYKLSIQWKSSNTKIATVDKNGKITAKSAGKATITATLNSKTKATCKVTVTPKPTKIKSAAKSGKDGIKITWNKVSGISNYEIYMSTKSSSGFKKIYTASASKTSYTKTKLKKGKKYYFKLRTAKKVSGSNYYSSYTSVKSVKR